MHSTCRICQVRVSLDFQACDAPPRLRRQTALASVLSSGSHCICSPRMCCMAQTASSARRRERSFSTCQAEATGHTLRRLHYTAMSCCLFRPGWGVG